MIRVFSLSKHVAINYDCSLFCICWLFTGWSLCNKKSTADVGWVPSSFLKRKVDTEEIELGFAAAIPGMQLTHIIIVYYELMLP